MVNCLRCAAIGAIVFGAVVVACGQMDNQLNGNDVVAQSLIEMERQWSESATPAEEIRVVQQIFADDFMGTNTEGKLYTKSEKIA